MTKKKAACIYIYKQTGVNEPEHHVELAPNRQYIRKGQSRSFPSIIALPNIVIF